MNSILLPNVVNVNITGAVKSGKTGVTAIILQALLDAGFNNDNINIVNQDNDLHGKCLVIDDVVKAMKEKGIKINLIDNNGNPFQK